ncbi:CHASE2 domain-containing protein [Paenibacillus sp. 481]|uniref:CHASE2 domain-containing protein n=1 Tax=Paenibacillus sp. 481 TaxID=2835869 RepID=UPI001E5D501D|nr:adenylate/guanylate cyclase domain-containing protein [Paenibacillus sp. 481]UHA72616.1 adenylate/guanylate cyclase domain-containing protein [Paenibacillus sp. 481]
MLKKAVPLFIVVVVFLFTTMLYTIGTGGPFYMEEQILRDALRSKSGVEQMPDDRIKIIAIDDHSLAQLGPFPWDRAVYAQLTEKLMKAGARAVALDLLFIEPATDIKNDKAISEQVNKYEQVFLPVQVVLRALQKETEKLQIKRVDRPSHQISVPESQLGHVNVMPDQDGVIRKMMLGLPDEQGRMIPSLGVLTANQLLPPSQQIKWDEQQGVWLRGAEVIPTNARHQVTIDYFSSPYGYDEDSLSGYDRQSFVDVYSGTIDPAYYKDTVVLIGAYATSLSDRHMTTVSRSMPLYGVEIHANIVQNLLEGRFYHEAALGWSLCALLLSVAVAVWCASSIRGARSVFFSIVLIGLYTIIWIFAYSLGSVFIPYVYALIGMVLGYALMSAYRNGEDRQARKQVVDIFGRYVSPAVVNELLCSEEPLRAGGTRQDVTIMFIDIRGFTPLAEGLDPERTLALLNRYLHVCAETVFQNHGTLDKFMGDGVMAIFGAPNRLDHHERHAVQAALELQERSKPLCAELEAEFGVSARFGIGIQSGEAVVGNIGSETLRLDYTAIGDTVNVAARLESQAKPGQILVGEETQRRICDEYKTLSLGRMMLKGKTMMISVFELLPTNTSEQERELMSGQHDGKNDRQMDTPLSGQNEQHNDG